MKKFIEFFKSPAVKSVFVLLVVFGIMVACSVSTAKLSDVKVCTTLNGSKECDSDKPSFSASDHVIYCSAQMKNAPADTKVTFTWKFGEEVIGTANATTGSGIVYSNFSPTGEVKPGKYSVTVKIETDNADPVTKSFTIE